MNNEEMNNNKISGTFCPRCSALNSLSSTSCVVCGGALNNNNQQVFQNTQQPMMPNQMQQSTMPMGQPNMYGQQPTMPMGQPVPTPVQPVAPMNGGMQMNQPNMYGQQPMMPNQMQQPTMPMGQPNMYSQQSAYTYQQYEQQNGNKPHKKGKKALIFISLAIIVIAIGIFIFVSGSGNKRAILIYMVGSNLESDNGLATGDLDEIKNSGINLNDTQIIVYTGGTNNWHGNYKNNAIYVLNNNGYELVKEYPKVSTGESSTLTTFIDYATSTYEADKYGLIFWDHGSGPIAGYGYDEVYDGDALGLVEISRAFNNSKYLQKNKFEFVGFDACLMASIEVGNMISNYSNYMIASEEVEPGYGWNYTFLKDVNSKTNTESLGKAIIDYTYDFYKEVSSKSLYDFTITLSLMDLTKIKTVVSNLSSLFKEVDVTLNNSSYSEIVNYVTKSKSFGYNGEDKSFDLIDLKEMSSQLENKYGDLAKNLTNSIDSLIIYQKSTLEGANGVSIYYPYYTKKYIDNFMKVYEALDFSKEYKGFLRNYIALLTGKSMVTTSVKSMLPEINEDKLSVTLDPQLVENYNSARYIIFRDMKDGSYSPIFTSSDVELSDSGVLTANFAKKELIVFNDKGSAGSSTMLEISRNEKEAIYQVPILLVKWGEDAKNGSANIILKIDEENPKGHITGIVSDINPNEVQNSRKLIDLKDWDNIYFYNGKYFITYEDGVPVWKENKDDPWYLAIVKANDFKIEFHDLFDDYDYYCVMIIKDTQGNSHRTRLIKVER